MRFNMWITPNSTVKVLKRVPLDDTYENTIWFNTVNDQVNTFSSYTKYTFQNPPAALTYQRVNKNSIRINLVADNLYDCNYLMFQNTAYGTKWFYAFIKQVNYINDNVTEIVYSIDDMQTWHFDYTLEQCFVEREHSATDTLGENLQPEHLATGDLFYDGDDPLFWYNPQFSPNEYTPCVVVAAPFNKNGGNSNGTVTGGMYSGLYYNIFSNNPTTGTSLLDELLDFFSNARVAARADDIITMFYFFKEFAVQTGTQDTPNRSYYSETKNVTRDLRGFKDNYSDANESYYVPHNNKLFTAPYNFLTVTDWQGHGLDYCYEYFGGGQIQFVLNSSLSVTPAIAFTPKNYMGDVPIDGDRNFDYSFWYSDFPRIPWITDGFVAWLAQTTAGIAGSMLYYVPQIAMAGVGGLEAAKMNSANAAFNNAIQSANELQTSMVDILDENMNVIGQTTAVTNKIPSKRTDYSSNYHMPSMSLNTSVQGLLASGAIQALKGTRTGGRSQTSPNWAINNIRVSAVHKKIRREYAERIDKYFDMYGYATNKIKVPNRSVRTEWTYTKTVGCTLIGSVPQDSARNICRIYDNGIRFWVDPSHIGNYSLSNNVLV